MFCYFCAMVYSSTGPWFASLFEEMTSVLGPNVTRERVVLTTSFSMEDQILTWAVLKAGLDVDLVSLDTGCLFPATRQTWKATEDHFGVEIRALLPDPKEVVDFKKSSGLSSIYESVESRKACCAMRKIRPLKAACEGKDWWITGLRSNQSANRAQMSNIEDAPGWGLKKFHPLLNWSDQEVETALVKTGVPVNPLYAMGYSSIGCAPCTRPVLPHEDARAGRWWWEQSSKECGLHRG